MCHTYKSESICYNEHRGDPEASKNEKENKRGLAENAKKMENEKKTGFIVYDFMKSELGLTGVTLQVYALIYSFTKAGSACHGSIEHIADRTKSSTASVQRALNFLVEQGYVTKRKISPKRPSIYTANLDSIYQNDSITNESINQNDSMIESKCEYDTIKMIDNNKEDNKGDNNNINELNIHSLIKEYWKDKPRPIQAFGSKKVVMMTLHQYANLLRAVGVKPTLRYVRLLENRITANIFPVKENHYEMIIDWAREDGFVTPEGEEILRN